MMGHMIQVKNVHKVYGYKGACCKALKQIDLTVEEGAFVAIMGPSGSGKTTLLNVLSTIDTTTEGEINIAGKRLNELKNADIARFRRDMIGFVFQDFNLLDNMSIRDNIALPLTLNNERYEEICKRTGDFTTLFGINDQLDKYPYQLSGGQKQRAAVCRALITKPKIIFADEPTGALDSRSASELLTCFKQARKKYGTTIIMVTHDAKAASFCDQVYFLNDGNMSGSLESSGDEKAFFRSILNMVATLGGSNHECL